MSINLTTPKVISVTGSQNFSETDAQGALMSYSIDFFGQTFTGVFRTGTVTGGNLNAGAFGDTVTLVVNLVTGAWTSSNGFSGTIGSTPLNNFNAQFKTDRNAAEGFAAGASGIMPGTQVPWT